MPPPAPAAEPFPFLEVSGTPHAWRLQYGKQGRERIERLGLSRADLARLVAGIEPTCAHFTPHHVEEMRGIATVAMIVMDPTEGTIEIAPLPAQDSDVHALWAGGRACRGCGLASREDQTDLLRCRSSDANTRPMEGFIARGDICSFTDVRAMSQRSDAKGLVQLGSHVLAILAAGVLVWAVSDTWRLMIPGQVVLGVLITFLFCPHHETVHRTAFASKKLNERMTWVLGFIGFLPSIWFRHFHFEHHRETHIKGRDPELEDGKPATKAGFLFYATGIKSFWWSSIRTLFRHAFGGVTDSFVPDEAVRAAIVRQARLYLLGYALIAVIAMAAGSWVPLTYWIVPMALSAWSLRIYLLAEHTLRPHTTDMLENTRTMRTNALVRWLAWQMPYHTEHHTFPSVPFHALHLAYEKIKPGHDALIPGYTAFLREYWSSLK